MHKARMLAVVALAMASMALQVPVTAMAAPSITAIESSDAGQNDVTVYFDTLVGKVPTITTSSSLAGTVYLNDVDVFDSANRPHTIPHATSVWVKTPDLSGVTYESPYSVRVDNAGHTLDRRAVDLVIDCDEVFLKLANGKDRTLEKPKLKKRKHARLVLRSETRVAEKLRRGDKVLNSELRRDLAFHAREMQGNDLGG